MTRALLLACCLLAAPLASAQVTLPITFEEDIDYELVDFGEAMSMLVVDPEDAANTVVQTDRPANAACFAGTTVANMMGFASPLPFADGATTMSIRVWTPFAGTTVRFKVENVSDPTQSVETQVATTVGGAWETLVFDFANQVPGTAPVNFGFAYTKGSIFFNFQCPSEVPVAAETYYWDDVSFGGTPTFTSIAAARALGDGAEVTVVGTVTRSKNDFTYIQDITGGLTIRQTSGMFADQVADGTVAPGTNVVLTGTLSSFNNLTQINGGGLSSYTVGGDGGSPAPTVISVQQLLDNGENYEGEVVSVFGLTTMAMGTFEASTNYDVTDGGGTGTLRVVGADDSDVDGLPIPTGSFDFTGVVGQFSEMDPFGGYQLLAINESDITVPNAGIPLPITFEDEIDYELADFGNAMSMIVADPEDAANTVVQTFRPMGDACFAGTTVAEFSGFAEALPFAEGATTMSVRVWSPEAGIPVLLKVENVNNAGESVETIAVTTVAMGWDTLVFDFANEDAGTAPINFAFSYTKASIFFDFWCRSGGPRPGMMDATYYWDDVVFGGAPSDPIALPVTFEEEINYELADFGNAASMIVADPEDAENTVVETFRPMGETCFAGTTVADMNGFTAPIPFTMDETTMSLRVWSPEVGIPVLLKVENVNNGGESVETVATTTEAMAWHTLVFDFANEDTGTAPLNLDFSYTKASVFFDFWCRSGGPRPGMMNATYYWDDLAFGSGDMGSTTIADARALGDGNEVTITGIVTRARGDFAYIQDATAGLTIRQTEGMFFDQVADGTIAPGTVLTLTGTLSTFRGLQQINEDDLASYMVGKTAGVPAPVAITVEQLNANGEAYEAELVQLTLTTAEMGTFAERTNYEVTDGTGTGVLRVGNADDSDIDGTEIPGGPFIFTGVVGQFTFDDPATNGYQLLAIDLADVNALPPPVALPVTFEEEVDYQLVDFGNAMSMIVEDPEDAANTVVETFRPMGETCFAGTTVGEVTGFTAPIPFTTDATIMTARVWSPEVGIPVLLKVENVNNAGESVETVATTTEAMAWHTLVFDFANEDMGTAPLNLDFDYTKASIFFDFWCRSGGPRPGMVDATYYWDDLAFGNPVSNEDEAGLPTELTLAPNYPNPFNRSTTVDFALPTQERVVIHVYNVLGQQVATLANDEMEAGRHSLAFDASTLAAGTYFLRLRAGAETLTRSMIVSR
ncbi:MAG: T9SS type A sorting domain-containing protein [Bacteroidota bacterium]